MKNFNNTVFKTLFLVGFVFVLNACQTQKKSSINPNLITNNNLNSTLWLQTSAEFKASAWQTYNIAQKQLDAVLADKSLTAAIEQTQDYSGLPPAIILDVDETILDNSPYQAQLIKNNVGFDLSTWDEWVSLKSAKAIPGAVDFINHALDKGVRIIFLTNRECLQREGNKDECPQKNDTLDNLKEVGIKNISLDHLMIKYERDNWTSEKQSRRIAVVENYRVLMLFGDDLGDFLPHVKKDITHQQRAALVQKHQQRWGHTWFVLGNPTYGSWQRVMKGDGVSNLSGYE